MHSHTQKGEVIYRSNQYGVGYNNFIVFQCEKLSESNQYGKKSETIFCHIENINSFLELYSVL